MASRRNTHPNPAFRNYTSTEENTEGKKKPITVLEKQSIQKKNQRQNVMIVLQMKQGTIYKSD